MRKGRPKVALILTAEERRRLESFAHRSRSAAALARRARIILACAEGTDSKVVTRRLHVTPGTVCKWRGRFIVDRLAGSTMSRGQGQAQHHGCAGGRRDGGTFRSVPQHKAAIQEFIDAHQADPRPFVWTKSADEILASIARFAQRTVDARSAQSVSRTTGTGH